MPLEPFALFGLATAGPGVLGHGALAGGVMAIAAVFRAGGNTGRTSLGAARTKALCASRPGYAQKSCECCQHDDETHGNPPLEAFDGVVLLPCCYRLEVSISIITGGSTEMKK